MAPAYSDMTYQLAGIDRPNPRVISNNVFTGPSGLPSYRNYTALFAFFGKEQQYKSVVNVEWYIRFLCPWLVSSSGVAGIADDPIPPR